MNVWRKLLVAALIFTFIMAAGLKPVQAKTYKLTVVAGHPPIFLWVSLTQDYLIPEIDQRLADAGGKDTVKWNQAYGGTVAKIGGVLEAIEEGVADLGFVGTLFEAPKMPLHNVSYMTPFGSSDIFTVVDTVTNLQEQIPEYALEWDKHNQVFLGGAGLDAYGLLTNFPVNTVDDLNGHKIAAPGPAANWIKGTGAVAVAGNLNTYYNDIKTGVYEGTLTFMTAAAAGKLQEVAPYICMVNFGAQFAGGITINKDVFDAFPPYMQKIFKDVGREYAQKLAQAQADKAAAAMKAMEAGGGKLIYLSDEERKKWADKLPNIPMEWAKTMDGKGLPGTKSVEGFLDGLRSHGTILPRDWDK